MKNHTLSEVIDAFDLFYRSIHNRSFRKNLHINTFNERQLSPLLRTFLLGYFGDSLTPEYRSKLPGSLSGYGSIDFKVGNIAIEFAVRQADQSRSQLSHHAQVTEIKKLMKHDGLSLLTLFDFSRRPFSEAQLERFREWPSLGKGNYKKSAFNVVYFFRENSRVSSIRQIRKNIRV